MTAAAFDAVPNPRQPVLADSVWQLTRPAWHAEAACFGSNVHEWYPERGGDSARVARQRIAICAGCPVLAPCRDHGIRHEVYGIFGGLTPRARRLIRKERGIVVESPEAGM